MTLGKREHETRHVLILPEGSSAKERSRVERRGGRGGRGSNWVIYEINGEFVRLEFAWRW